eukprot:scaffold12233_cov129-Isochrysis_galbana.AAC.4
MPSVWTRLPHLTALPRSGSGLMHWALGRGRRGILRRHGGAMATALRHSAHAHPASSARAGLLSPISLSALDPSHPHPRVGHSSTALHVRMATGCRRDRHPQTGRHRRLRAVLPPWTALVRPSARRPRRPSLPAGRQTAPARPASPRSRDIGRSLRTRPGAAGAACAAATRAAARWLRWPARPCAA